MTNIRCKRNKEIDLLAINPRTGLKFHIESRVGTSPSFSIRLHDTYTKKGRPHKIGIDYFAKKKFNHEFVKAKIKEIFGDVNYKKILVVWDVQDKSVVEKAKEEYDIYIVFIDSMLHTLAKMGEMKGSRDEILRMVELMTSSERAREKTKMRINKRQLKAVWATGLVPPLSRSELKTLERYGRRNESVRVAEFLTKSLLKWEES